MTLETIDLNRGCGVAALAKLTRRVDRSKAAFAVCAGVTINTLHQAVPFTANTLMHSDIPLVEKQIHMIPAHVLGGFNAVFHLSGLATGSYLRVGAEPECPEHHNYDQPSR